MPRIRQGDKDGEFGARTAKNVIIRVQWAKTTRTLCLSILSESSVPESPPNCVPSYSPAPKRFGIPHLQLVSFSRRAGAGLLLIAERPPCYLVVSKLQHRICTPNKQFV